MKCQFCGNEIESDSKLQKQLNDNCCCFRCNFWLEKVEEDQLEPDRIAIISGTHYYIGDEDSKETYFRGFSGHQFTIHFKDGRVVKTTNLWCQGDIPEHFKYLFPNNAEFDYEWKKSCDGTFYLVKK